jgi:hypothetical protein
MTSLKEVYDNRQVVSLIDLKRDQEIVIEIQERLHDLGIYTYGANDPDGLWGARTEQGLKQFCDAVFLNNFSTGLFGPTFAEALIEARQIRPMTPSRFGVSPWWSGGGRDALAKAIANEGSNQGINNRNQLCYIMATIQHETAHTYAPIAEFRGKSMWYAPYYGRGYVQLTHKGNYETYSRLLGRNFVAHPDEVMEPNVSLFIIVHGMKNGTFTGVALNDYISDRRTDFYNARNIVNSLDKARLIEGYAIAWQSTTLF